MRVLLSVLILAVLNSVPQSVRAEDGLIAHWKLSGNARDSSGHGLHAENHGAKFNVQGPHGKRRGAVQFDGKSSFLNVPNSDCLGLGTSDFSILTWVHTDESLDDVPGDILNKFDPDSRTGFQLSLDSRPGVTSSQSNWRNLHFGIDSGQSETKWTDHGRLGKAVLIYGMAVHNGQLFAGTCVAGEKEAGRVFRFDGEKWTDCGAPDLCNAVSSLAVFQGKLYVGVSKYRLGGSSLTESENPNFGGKIYRYDGDNKWVHCGTLPEVEAINGMVVYRNQLYASSMYAPASFFRYEGGTKWTSLGTPDEKRVESLTVFNGHIYATGYDEGAVYRFDGKTWDHMGVIPEATQTYGFAAHNGHLYVSEWPHAKVFRFGGKKDQWLYSGRLGEEKESMPLAVYNGKMYSGTLPTGEVYRLDAKDKWTNVGRLDFTPDVKYRRVWSMSVYKGRLFAGTLPSGHVHSIEVGKNVTYDRALKSGWRHVAAVKQSKNLLLYVDGKLVGKSSDIDPAKFNLSNNQPLKIGFGANDYFNGRLSDLRIYSRALSAKDISKISNKASQ